MTVYLVGAGPGDPDFLTVRAVQLLQRANVLVHDRLVSPLVLALAGPSATRIDVGKEPGRSNTQVDINELLVDLGRRHACVVRLKGGDPYVFGRGGEEALALAARGVAVEVVPGVTSAFAGPLLAGIPVTHRGLSHGVTVVTGSSGPGVGLDFRRVANPDVTLVVLMGVQRRAQIAAELVAGGLGGATPVAVIERASSAEQRVVRCRLDELGSTEVSAPAVIVVGAVAALELGAVNAWVTTMAMSS